MQFSIITVNLNNAEGLRKTIESVVNQTFTDYEYIIIDGGSTDNSVDVIKEYAEIITYWVSEKDQGIYNAMNKGIKAASGNVICFINSGDVIFTSYCLKIVAEYIDNSQAELFFGNAITISETNGNMKYWDISEVKDRADLLTNTFFHASTFYSKNLFNKCGLFNEEFTIVSDVDWYMNALVNQRIKFKTIPYPTSIFYHGRGISSSNWDINHKERAIMFNTYFSNPEISLFSGSTFRKIKGIFLLNILFHLKLNKDKNSEACNSVFRKFLLQLRRRSGLCKKSN